MKCPYCKDAELVEEKQDYHHTDRALLSQPINRILSTLYRCPECGVTVETSQQVRIVPPKKEG